MPSSHTEIMLKKTYLRLRQPRAVSRLWAAGIALGLLGCGAMFLSATDLKAPRAKLKAGISYQHDVDPDRPWSIHIAKLDLSRDEYELVTTLARGTNIGMSTLSDQIKLLPAELGKPMAAINGDFYRDANNAYQGDPLGLQIRLGELVSSPGPNAAFWIDANGRPQMTNVLSQLRVTWPGGESTPFGVNEERTNGSVVLYTSAIGSSTHTTSGRELVLERAEGDWLPLRAGASYTAKVRAVRETGDTLVPPDLMVLSLSPEAAVRLPKIEAGALLKISTATTPDLAGVKTALGGGPALVRAGKANSIEGPYPRHPRTALGWNKNYLYLLQVDGRQSDLSIGMTFPELAAYFVKLGCDEAINLDGGGSATFWYLGQVMNSPCYGHERTIANGLVILRKSDPSAP